MLCCRIRRSARLSGHKRRYGDDGVDLLESYDTDDELYDEQLMDDGDMDSLGSVEEEVDDDDDSAEVRGLTKQARGRVASPVRGLHYVAACSYPMQ